METEEPSTEEDLVGVTQVTYIQPDPEPEDDPENITLPLEVEEVNKEACTISHVPMKKELPSIDSEDGNENEEGEQDEADSDTIFVVQKNEEEVPQGQSLEDPDLEAIAEAVKNTLSQHPGLNIQGQLQLKVDQVPGKPTQVQVTTADGAVIVMELITEDEPEAVPEMNQEINDDGELKIFQCPDCPKSFARRIQLRRHASVHMQQRGKIIITQGKMTII